jgi:hypothetical protein
MDRKQACAILLFCLLAGTVDGQAQSPGRWEKRLYGIEPNAPPAVLMPCTASVSDQFFMFGGEDSTGIINHHLYLLIF